jgi:hypothetical protein
MHLMLNLYPEEISAIAEFPSQNFWFLIIRSAMRLARLFSKNPRAGGLRLLVMTVSLSTTARPLLLHFPRRSSISMRLRPELIA